MEVFVDWQTAFNVVFGLLAGMFGWLARSLWDAVKKLEENLATFREEVASDRVHKDDFRDSMRELKDMFTRIYDKLDGKADKHDAR